MSVCTNLQTRLYEAGILWRLIPNLFQYDFTLDEGGVEKAEESNQQVREAAGFFLQFYDFRYRSIFRVEQELQNKLARVSCDACACLAGLHEPCPANEVVRGSLAALLTPYICSLMKISGADRVKNLCEIVSVNFLNFVEIFRF